MIHLFCCDGGIKLIIVYSSSPQTVFILQSRGAHLVSVALTGSKTLFEDVGLGFGCLK